VDKESGVCAMSSALLDECAFEVREASTFAQLREGDVDFFKEVRATFGESNSVLFAAFECFLDFVAAFGLSHEVEPHGVVSDDVIDEALLHGVEDVAVAHKVGEHSVFEVDFSRSGASYEGDDGGFTGLCASDEDFVCLEVDIGEGDLLGACCRFGERREGEVAASFLEAGDPLRCADHDPLNLEFSVVSDTDTGDELFGERDLKA